MIYVLCSGGLGNQMFQYAYLLHLKRAGKEAVLDTSFFKHNNIHSGYTLEKAFRIVGSDETDHFTKLWKIRYSLMARQRSGKQGSIYMEQDENFIDESQIKINAVLYGYWQGEKFFQDVRDEVKRRFSFQNISNTVLDTGGIISSEESVAVHVRRGDYLHNPKYVNLSATEYYKYALSTVRERMSSANIYVFSDDIAWCKESGLFENATYVDFTTEAYEDMYLMSKAKAIITANSSFSWWAGYLGNHEFVIRPEKYLNNWTKSQDDRLYPSEWIVGKFGG